MGSGGAKTTNRMLAEQTARANAIGNTAGARSKTAYDAGRGDIDFARGEFRSMYDQLGEDEGGGGYSYTPAMFESEALPFYLQLMREGGYDQATKSAIESAGSAPISSAFEALKRNLATARAGRGLGYGGGTGRIARDQAYAMGEMGKQVMGELSDRILASRERGAAGVTGIESEKRSFESEERARAASAAASGRGRADDIRNQRRQLLYDLLGLEDDKDLSYMDRQLAAGGLGMNTVSNRKSETPAWISGLGGLIGPLASSALGSFGSTAAGRKNKDNPSDPTTPGGDYYDPYFEGWGG